MGFYAEVSPYTSDNLHITAGFREDRYSDFGWEYAPSVSASCRVTQHLRLRSSVGRSFRIPTFTDLYYVSAANIGNTELKPEYAWNYEIGLDLIVQEFSLLTTVFRRDSEDLIDWTRQTPAEAWRARNIGTVNTNGLELALVIDLKEKHKMALMRRISADYTVLDSYFKHGYLSKYSSDYLKHHIASRIELELPFHIENSWVLNYKRRKGDSGYIVVDAKFSKKMVRKEGIELEAFIEATNLFDREYSEQSDIPLPGRWIKAGIRVTF